MREPGEIFISGIDTDTGKTIATGLLARYFKKKGIRVITQKIVQTGCAAESSDISIHRKLMGIPLHEADKTGLTCPYLFQFPASPHLSAKLAGRTIDCRRITDASRQLARDFDMVLIEGAGGLLVPLNDTVTVLDYIQARQYPVVLVSSAKLGSINHTLLSIEALKHRRLRLLGVVYNRYPGNDHRIVKDSAAQIAVRMARYGYPPHVIEMDPVDITDPPDLDFSFITG